MIKKEEITTKLAEQKKKILKKHAELINDLTNLKDVAKEENKTLYRKSDHDLGVMFTSAQIQQQYQQIIEILNLEHKELSCSLEQIVDDDPLCTQKILAEIKKTIGFRYRSGHKQSNYTNLQRTFCIYFDDDKQYKIAVTFGSKNTSGNKDEYKGKVSGSYKQVRTGTSIIFSDSKFEHVAKISLNKNYLDVFDHEAKIFEKIPSELCPFRFGTKTGTFFSLGHKIGKEITFFAPEAKNDLFDEVSTQNMTEKRRIYVFAKLLNDLNILHERNIAHRDIKLENIFIGYDTKPYYGDFGLSGKEKSILGTLEHASPRLLKNYVPSKNHEVYMPYITFLKDRIDQNEMVYLSQNPHNPYADDIWALGISYYICKSAKNPKDDMNEFANSIKNDIFISALLCINEAQRANPIEALLILTARYIEQYDGANSDSELKNFLLTNLGGYEKFINAISNEIERLTKLSESNLLNVRKLETYRNALNNLNEDMPNSNSKRIR